MVEGKAAQGTVRAMPRASSTVTTAVPERWVPERILRGHLVGVGFTAEIARCGEGMVLTGPEVPGDPLVCRVDRGGPCGSRLDEPLAQAASGVLAGLLGRDRDGRGRRVRSSLLCAAALLQAQLSERRTDGRPEFGLFGHVQSPPRLG